MERLGAELLGWDRVRRAGSAVPCCSTAGVEWRPPHPPQAGPACPRTLLFPPPTQLGRNSPKPRSRPESSLCVPSRSAVPARGQRSPFQLQRPRPAGPRLTRTSPGADPTIPLQSHPLPEGCRAREGTFPTCRGEMKPPLFLHLLPARGKGPRPQGEAASEGDEGLTLCPSPMTR